MEKWISLNFKYFEASILITHCNSSCLVPQVLSKKLYFSADKVTQQ